MLHYTVTVYVGRDITRQYDIEANDHTDARREALRRANEQYPGKRAQVYHVRYRPVHATH